jgi:type I restriction enzyme M protein
MSEKFVLSHRGRLDDISIFGQESNHTTYKLCRMNLAIRGIDGSQVQWNSEGSFLKDAHPDLKADYILANPPFNQDEWGWEIVKNDPRWKYGTPPPTNANFGWMQHMIYHLSPKGVMATVLSNGSLASNQGGEGEIRKNLLDADLVDCIVSLPKQLFYNTGIPACIWYISRKRLGNGDRKRNGEILFIDASEIGGLVDRTHREFTSEEVKKIASTYHEWRSKESKYKDIKGFCKSATVADVQKRGYVLTPGRYAGAADSIDDGVSFEDKMAPLADTLKKQIAEEGRLNEEITEQLKKVGF